MSRNDCRLTCWNQNLDIPILFKTPACQMNDDRQIAAESRQIFIFCSLKLWSYCTDLHQNFTRCRFVSVAINPLIYKEMLQFLEMPEQRAQTVNFDVYKNDPKLIGYHSNVSSMFNFCKNYFIFIICIHEPTIAEKLLKFGLVLAEIFGMIGLCQFLPTRPIRYRNSLRDLLGLVDRSSPKLHRIGLFRKLCPLSLRRKNCDIWIHCKMPACWI